jgi:hypothetical protein
MALHPSTSDRIVLIIFVCRYKIQPQELALPGNTLSECAVSRIAVRDAL